MIDFSACKIDYTRTYGGRNGKKIGIIYNDELYMLKFPSTSKNKDSIITYSSNLMNEYISCHIFNSIGIPTQETLAGIYRKNNKEYQVVACKDLEANTHKLKSFGELKNAILEVESDGYTKDLQEALIAIREQNRLNPIEVEKRFWDMMVGDTLVGNFDRHNGNWGFLINNQTNNWTIAPVYDCGSTLLPSAEDEFKKELLHNKQLFEERIYVFPNHALTNNGQKINMFDFAMNTDEVGFHEALKRIVPKIDYEKINNIIEKTPFISEVNKEFLKEYIKARNELILIPALEKVKKVDKSIINDDFQKDTKIKINFLTSKGDDNSHSSSR